MLLSYHCETIGLLADGRLCNWIAEALDLEPDVIGNEIATAKSFKYADPFIVLTHDLRVLIYTSNGIPRSRFSDASLFIDITSTLHEVIGEEIITEVLAFKEFRYQVRFAIATKRSFSTFTVRYPYNGFASEIKVAITSTYTLSSDINLIRTDHCRGFIRTDDGSMYALPCPFDLERFDWAAIDCDPYLVDIDNAESICEIGFNRDSAVFLRDDGSVQVYASPDCMRAVILPHGTHIIKAVVRDNDAFYLAADGTCYYDTFVIYHSERVLKVTDPPVPIRSLIHKYVEDIYVLSPYLLVQHDGLKLSALVIDSWIDLAFIEGTYEPISLDYFDDKCVVDIIKPYHKIFVVTDDGRVYDLELPDTSKFNPRARVCVTELPFFNDNPLAISSSPTNIRSARSILKLY